ncbi:polysaccharide pyruvyl transferase family protein [Bacillus sp. B1-b2]|uniref:polysaccharide pyruvyl transferase family protein n=1 Tax=Bacillus sp. B1-b2 TaxID=2653201 RepID=UPI001262A02E|nr:polysaccharide pyruvyl transferase family protein [Bacillus sp. B1-b2]KAB7671722.1 pyruvyl transferase [Bacillus sp. B1-b2]
MRHNEPDSSFLIQKKRMKEIIKKYLWNPIRLIPLINQIKLSNKPKIFLIGTPRHGNLGDQAIAFAMITFLKDRCKDYELIEIRDVEVERSINVVKNLIKGNDVIALMGGGNIGIQYFDEERLRRNIIKNFQKNKIIIFPQTIYFGNTERGKAEFIKTKSIYNSHPYLTIVGREKKSYEIMNHSFLNNTVLLTPDIVLYLEQSKPIVERKGILVCLRDDVESTLDSSFKEKIIESVSDRYNVDITDTVVPYRISKKERSRELEKIWTQFRKSKLVITDRLHGMVFAAITGTPCIVIKNYNHKVKGTYDWINQLSYIRFIEDNNNIFSAIEEMLESENSIYDNEELLKYYGEILTHINRDMVNSDDLVNSKLL